MKRRNSSGPRIDPWGFLSLAHVGRVGLVCLQAKELRNFHSPKPQVCGGEWAGILGAVQNVATSVGCKVRA